ncbi:hypothetical protein IV203_023568 [Nitzschia inconspicua]|uniref:Uncharacterized protein n=1 Tax=Nitzschia inconspicua TaxID=303405 RepID=A0A9K3KDG2_9STRA|nr:hypothetical protein IV203_023568 [Nitzschia inconspicua]
MKIPWSYVVVVAAAVRWRPCQGLVVFGRCLRKTILTPINGPTHKMNISGRPDTCPRDYRSSGAHSNKDALCGTNNLIPRAKSLPLIFHPTEFGAILAAVLTSYLLITPPLPAHAGEVGAKITKAVTTSDLGISVRQSVVKGAQIMDKIDGQWERLSDKLGLGAVRSKQSARPKAKVIPELQPLDVAAANRLLQISDMAFLRAYPGGSLSNNKLQQEVDGVAKMVQVSFQRSGVAFVDPARPLEFETGPQFNFAVYSHYKAYSNLLLTQQQSQNSKDSKSFATIRADFERFVGQALLDEWKIKETSSSPLTRALQQTDTLATKLRDFGFAASVDPSPPIDSEDWQDFLEGDVPELNWNVAVDGDITLNAQILLQEQGYRIYPNIARFVLQQIFQDVLAQATAQPGGVGGISSATKVSVMDYYFDTDYTSDPDKFEAKEVLLSVSLENE